MRRCCFAQVVLYTGDVLLLVEPNSSHGELAIFILDRDHPQMPSIASFVPNHPITSSSVSTVIRHRRQTTIPRLSVPCFLKDEDAFRSIAHYGDLVGRCSDGRGLGQAGCQGVRCSFRIHYRHNVENLLRGFSLASVCIRFDRIGALKVSTSWNDEASLN